MPIYIKYNLENDEIKYNSFEDINDYNKVVYIKFSSNQLSSLPKLPNLLLELYCYKNQLTELPELPNSLQILGCSHNQLTILPKLPNSHQILLCDNNQLIKNIKYTYLNQFIYM